MSSLTGNGSFAAGGDAGFAFGHFHMDVASHRLWRGRREIRLRPKVWEVLRYLVERAGLLVTREALHHEIWRDTTVSDDALTQSIVELRRALGDSTRTPRFIETVHGLGFRFDAPVTRCAGELPGPAASTELASWSALPAARGPALPLAGRQVELSRLDDCLSRAHGGARQVVFVTGETGIGKTRLVGEFLCASSSRSKLLVLQGQCIQQYGPREPYMPVLEALERVLRSPAGVDLVALFRRLAPCWYSQLPSLWSDAERAALPSAPTRGASERMLREIAIFLETMATFSMVVLVLEDLHWSDTATVELLAHLAQRPDPARLLILATYRPAEASVDGHPICDIKQVLRLRGHCIELPLDGLSPSETRGYLCARFGDDVQHLAPAIHERTDGHPLFMVAVLDELIRRGLLAEATGRWTTRCSLEGKDLPVPDEVREMIVSQARRLSPGDRDVLEAASVAGMKVDTDILARAIARDLEEVDEVARRLVWPHQFLDALDDPSDDERGRHYQFVHGLHRHVLYERLPVARRRRFHQSIAIAYAEHALGLLRRHAEQRTAHPSAQLAAISSLPRVRPCWRMLCDSCS